MLRFSKTLKFAKARPIRWPNSSAPSGGIVNTEKSIFWSFPPTPLKPSIAFIFQKLWRASFLSSFQIYYSYRASVDEVHSTNLLRSCVLCSSFKQKRTSVDGDHTHSMRIPVLQSLLGRKTFDSLYSFKIDRGSTLIEWESEVDRASQEPKHFVAFISTRNRILPNLNSI